MCAVALMRKSWVVRSFRLVLLLAVAATSAETQLRRAAQGATETSFNEDEPCPQPVPLDEPMKQTLAEDPTIADVLKDDQLSAAQMPGNWFEICPTTLGDSEEGWVAISTGPEVGANFTVFRILRRSPKGYSVVLKAGALGITLLTSETHGLRDVRTGILIGLEYDEERLLRFDGDRYQVISRESTQVDVTAPTDLTRFETREPLIQPPSDNDSQDVFTPAREWIWSKWKARTPAHLTIKSHDENDNQQTAEYFVTKNSEDDWVIVLKIHRDSWERDEGTGPLHRVTGDDLSSASIVRRVDTSVDNADDDLHTVNSKVFPDDVGIAPDKYRLQFMNDQGTVLHTL
jgi:hypothetical protein